MELSTQYLGLELKHPIVPGSSPLCLGLDSVRRLEDAGAAAIVMGSLFEDQLVADSLAAQHFQDVRTAAHQLGSPLGLGDRFLSPDVYLDRISRIKEAVAVPVIASLTGSTLGGWLHYAKLLEQAHADAIELNFYAVPTDLHESAAAIENRLVEMLDAVKKAVSIPVAVKLMPFYTSLLHLTARLELAGADGLVLFNALYEPEVDLDGCSLTYRFRLSTSSELGLVLFWTTVFSNRFRCSLGASGGIHTPEDAIKALLCGASIVQVVSALMQHGPAVLETLRTGLAAWLEDHGFDALHEAQGRLSRRGTVAPAPGDSARRTQILKLWTRFLRPDSLETPGSGSSASDLDREGELRYQ